MANLVYYINGDGKYTVTTSDNIVGIHFIDSKKVMNFDTWNEVTEYFGWLYVLGDVKHLVRAVVY